MRSGNATTILLIVALIVGVASTILIITVARSSPQPTTKATSLTPDQPLLPSVPKSTPSGQARFTTPATSLPAGSQSATSSTSISTITNLSPGDIDTYTALSTDKTTFLIDFIAVSFQPITLITYTINYTADVSSTATAKSIQGSFSPSSVLITGYKPSGYSYIRKSFTLGVCSGVTCTYDTNPRTFSVTVSAKLIGS